MPVALQSALRRLTGAVSQFSLAQKVFAVIAAAAVAIGGYGVYTWASKPTMTPLFSGLSGTDAQAVIDQLNTDGVSYTISDGGSTINVPNAKVYTERIALAAKGLPTDSNGEGYSLLDKLSATSTQFQEQTTYQRALEGELAKTIEAMDEVQTASVKLAIPQDTVFTATKADPTASVFVKTTAGSSLSASQVQAIVHLVSAGITGMKSTDVAVIDSNGTVLSTVGGTTSGSAVADQQTADYESKVQAAVHQLLDPLVGAANVTVTDTAQLNYDSSQKTIESYSSDPTVKPLTESTTSEAYGNGTGSGATGVLGPDNIAVPTGSSSPNPTASSYLSQSDDRTNAVNKTTEVITAAPGTVQKQSVAVAINATAGAGLDMTALQSTIAAAAGIDAARGDVLSVQRVTFDTSAATAAQAALAAADSERKAAAKTALIRQSAIAAGVLLFLVVAFVTVGRRSRRARREAVDLGSLDVAEHDEAATLPAGAPIAPQLERAPVDETLELKRRQIAALADDQPDEVADLLRGWLTESRR